MRFNKKKSKIIGADRKHKELRQLGQKLRPSSNFALNQILLFGGPGDLKGQTGTIPFFLSPWPCTYVSPLHS